MTLQQLAAEFRRRMENIARTSSGTGARLDARAQFNDFAGDHGVEIADALDAAANAEQARRSALEEAGLGWSEERCARLKEQP